MSCDICNDYKVMTVAVKRKKQTIEICFSCIEENNYNGA